MKLEDNYKKTNYGWYDFSIINQIILIYFKTLKFLLKITEQFYNLFKNIMNMLNFQVKYRYKSQFIGSSIWQKGEFKN